METDRTTVLETFDVQGLIARFAGQEAVQQFLNSLAQTQLFENWCQDRVALKAEGYPKRCARPMVEVCM